MTVAVELVERLRDEVTARVYVACAGGGAGLQQMLWSVPGASSFLVGATFPYATDAVDEVIGFAPERYCSEATAMDLASAAFTRAGGGHAAVGVGVTAKVASVEAHRGPHRVFAASVTRRQARLYSMDLDKGEATEARARDGARADALGLVALLDAVGLPSDALRSETGEYAVTDASELGRERLFTRPMFRANGAREPAPEKLRLAFPGTFDPPHSGHLGMAVAVEALTGTRPVMWITAEPPHKPPVPFAELLRRARRLHGYDVLFSRGEPLYIDKARRYPGCAFLIGSDSLVRLLDPKWGLDVPALVKEFTELGTRFYVTSRVTDGTLLTLGDIPDAPRHLCIEVDGRWDVSSTELRRSIPP
jgi:nicotinic acid mononucleotide adenylyltransferase/nicotinamide mononucleotide (NMN) deamidase PncC